MIALSAFDYEKKLKNPSKLFTNTWKSKSFINGPAVKEFENKFANYCRTNTCVSVGSCTSALQLSLIALSIGTDDEVITVPYTWVSTAECIKQVGANPIFVDIDPRTYCIDPKKIAEKITSKTKAIISVDLFGHVSDIDALKKFNVPIIQDAAQSTGAIYKGKRVGSLAHLTCFSFYPTKNLSCWGDAGAVTGLPEYIDEIKKLRNHGQSKRFQIERIGWNSRLDSIQAEVLIHKLPYLDKWNKRRREIASYYNSELEGIVTIPYVDRNCIHVYHQYVINHVSIDRIQDALTKNNIQSRVYYPTPLNKNKNYSDNQTYPNAEMASLSNLAIPVHQYLTDKQAETIIKVIKKSI